ncbi:hypothetical protein ACI48D_04960 [Massilia sp. LXY-6]|uniref:hypothetical protein n=1 Tax=Massilia sp. LXY-6 TaxID=3379823 RepID=UPI003EDEE811
MTTTDRPNTTLAIDPDYALGIEIELGTRAGTAFPEQRGAGFALTCRVLAEPDRRRARTVDLPPGTS